MWSVLLYLVNCGDRLWCETVERECGERFAALFSLIYHLSDAGIYILFTASINVSISKCVYTRSCKCHSTSVSNDQFN